ncbi:hypothetical protein Tco_1321832 [Tanacetum coccineum]
MKDEKKDDEKKDNAEDKDIDDHTDHALVESQETETVSPSTATTSKTQQKKRRISSKYNHIQGVIHRWCRRQGYMIQRMEKIYVTDREFWKVHGKVDKMKYNLQDQAANPALSDVLKRKFETSFTSPNSCRDDALHPQHHDAIMEMILLLRGRKGRKDKRLQRKQQDRDAWIEPQVIDEDEVIPKDITPELIED